jgi:hypothetical protein
MAEENNNEYDILYDNIKKCIEIFNKFFYIIIILMINISTVFSNSYSYIKDFLIRDSYDNLIYRVRYLDHVQYKEEDVYDLSLFKRFCLLFEKNKIDFDLTDETKNKIKGIINFNDKGYLSIDYYDKNQKNTVFISLELFKNTNFLFKHSDNMICNVIQNFIKNTVIYEDRNILYTELKYGDKTDNITQTFKKIKNSLKTNNMKLKDLVLLLNSNICNLDDLDKVDFSKFSLVLTDGDLEEKIFKIDEYLNFKTLYEGIAENELKK